MVVYDKATPVRSDDTKRRSDAPTLRSLNAWRTCMSLASNLRNASSKRMTHKADQSGDDTMSATRETTAGFVGLGMMGGPMAENIIKAGHPLVVYDVDARKVERFVAL